MTERKEYEQVTNKSHPLPCTSRWFATAAVHNRYNEFLTLKDLMGEDLCEERCRRPCAMLQATSEHRKTSNKESALLKRHILARLQKCKLKANKRNGEIKWHEKYHVNT